MIEVCRNNICHFNESWISEVSGEFQLVENTKGGESIASFRSERPCILIKADRNAPLLWSLKQRKCADGAIVTFNEKGAHLHIIELKGNVNLESWKEILKQFEGMYLTALAVLRLLDVGIVESVTCYIGAKADKISVRPLESSSPALIKVAVGGTRTIGGREEWTSEKVSLPFQRTAKLVKRWKDSDGNVDFSAIN